MDLQHFCPFHLGGLTLLFLVWKKVKRKFGKNCTEYLASSSLCTIGLQSNQDLAKPRNASFWDPVLESSTVLTLRWEVWLGLYLELVRLYECSKICFSLQGPFKNTKGLAVSSTLVGFFPLLACFILYWKEQFLHWILLWNEIYANILGAKV